LPRNPGDFRFRGVDGRGRVELVRDPSSSGGTAVVRIEDSKGGREGYTFDLEWRGGSGYSTGTTDPYYGGRSGGGTLDPYSGSRSGGGTLDPYYGGQSNRLPRDRDRERSGGQGVSGCGS
jgi:hypothetical protein